MGKLNDFSILQKQNQIITPIISLNLLIHSLSHLNMSVLNSFLNLIQNAVFVMFIIPAAFKTIEFVHRFNQMQTLLKEAETQIIRLQNTVEDLRYQVEDQIEDNRRTLKDQIEDNRRTLKDQIEDNRRTMEDQIEDNRRTLKDQIIATADMQQQLVDHSIDAVSTTKEIGDIYECLDLLDDRLLEFARTHKTKKQLRREKKEIEMLDQRNPTEECFDEFIADCLVYDASERIGKNELTKLFRVWCDKTHQKINTTEIELEGYMIRNFGPPEESEDAHKVSRKENKRDSSWTGLKSKSK